MIEQAMVTLLTAANSGATTIRPNMADQNDVRPYIVFSRPSGIPVYSMGGMSGLNHARYQIDCYGTTYANAKAMYVAVKNELDGYKGTVGTEAIQSVRRLGDHDFFEPPQSGQGYPIHGVSVDVMVAYTETTSN